MVFHERMEGVGWGIGGVRGGGGSVVQLLAPPPLHFPKFLVEAGRYGNRRGVVCAGGRENGTSQSAESLGERQREREPD